MSDHMKIDRRQMLALGAGAAALAGQAATAQTATEAGDGPDLSGKSILVTGSSSGFGRLGVEYYARRGAKVFGAVFPSGSDGCRRIAVDVAQVVMATNDVETRLI